MFDDLIALFSGWYYNFVGDIIDILKYRVGEYQYIGDGVYDYVENDIIPSVWSAFVPWEQIIAAIILVVMIVSIFKLLRSVLCKIL